PKERDLGADIGLIVEVKNNGHRIVKALWFQAKKTERIPESVSALEDLPRQIASMRKQTPEAYTLIYSADGVHVFQGDSLDDPLPLPAVVGDALFCTRGDRTPRVIALTADA